MAVFWSRFGTPTGAAASGTAEEIKRGIRLRKKVLVYFSTRAPPPTQANPLEDSKIEAFRKVFGQKALYWVYNDLGPFESAFRNHLAAVMHELLRRSRKRTPP